MKGLILKDFINLKKNFRIFGILSLLYIFMAYVMKDAGFFSSIVTMLFAILTLSLFSYDDMAKWDIYALTMPVTKDSMVSSKYIMLLLLTLLGTVFSSIISIIMNIALKSDNILVSIPNSLIGAFIVIMLYAVVLPFIIKLGVEKARMVFFVVMIIPFVIVSVLQGFIKDGFQEVPKQLVTAFDFLSRFSGIILPAIAILVLYISYSISVEIYRKKEF